MPFFEAKDKPNRPPVRDCGYFVIQDYAGRWYNQGQWIADWRQAEPFYPPLEPDSGARALVRQLKESGHGCLIQYIPGSPN